MNNFLKKDPNFFRILMDMQKKGAWNLSFLINQLSNKTSDINDEFS